VCQSRLQVHQLEVVSLVLCWLPEVLLIRFTIAFAVLADLASVLFEMSPSRQLTLNSSIVIQTSDGGGMKEVGEELNIV
jgi:hypothetical protein